MDFDELLSLLDFRTIKKQIIPFPTIYCNGVMTIRKTSRIAFDVEAALVFTEASLFNTFPDDFIEHKPFVILADEPLKPISANANILIMDDYLEWLDALELLSAEFRILYRKKESILNLTSLVNRGTTLEKLVNEAAGIVDAPASVLDNSLSFLAYSHHFPFYITQGRESTPGTLPDDALALMRKKGLVRPSKAVDLLTFEWVNFEGDTVTNHFSFIHSRSTIVGSISFFTRNSHLRKSRADMIPAIAQVLSIQMQKSNSYLLNKSLYYTHIFSQLEEGSFSGSSQDLQRQLSLFGYQLQRHLHIFYIDISREYTPAEQVRQLARQMHPSIENSFYVIKETHIIFVASSPNIKEDGFYDKEALEKILRGTSISIGISSIYLDLKMTPSYIHEAERAIQVGRKLNPDKCIFPFADYRLLDLVYCAQDNTNLYSYRFPPLMHVVDLDEQNDTMLTNTLYEYLQNPDDPMAVAKKLFIHRNTLYYRLDKIREIMGCDFKDAETIACIQMSFHVFRIQNKFNQLVRRTHSSKNRKKMTIK